MGDADRVAREILAEIACMPADAPLDLITRKLIFGGEQSKFEEAYDNYVNGILREKQDPFCLSILGN